MTKCLIGCDHWKNGRCSFCASCGNEKCESCVYFEAIAQAAYDGDLMCPFFVIEAYFEN
jgi:hypothetical protein